MKDLKKFWKAYKEVVISVALMLGVLIGVIFGVYPVVLKILEMQNASAIISKNNRALQTKVALLESIDEETYKQYLRELAYAVPTDKSLSSLFSTIDGLSTLTGVLLSDFVLERPGSIASDSAKRQTGEEKKLGNNFLPFTLTVSGTYEQINAFVAESIRVRRFFRIRSFDITFSSSGTISTRMGMDAYYAPLPTQLGSAGKAIEQITEEDEKIISKISALPYVGGIPGEEIGPATGVEVIGPPREDPFSL